MSHKPIYDVAIIGGGLAGLCLSIQAADLGYKVVLFEKETYPFHKVCGEFISLESWDFLIRLGVPLDEWDLPVIKKFQSSDVSGRVYHFGLPLGGFGISRYKLDNFLFNLAVEKGVLVHTGSKVLDTHFHQNQFSIRTVDEQVYARVVAGTFGKRSNLDIKWNRDFTLSKSRLSNYIGVKYHVRYPHDHNVIALHNFKDGYCGISKIEEDKSCLCYLTTAANLKASKNSIRKMEEDVLHKNPLLQKIFTEAEFLYSKPLTISQISFSNKNQVQDGILLLGDAAGMITPLCGNGMSMAMHGSKLAMLSINKFLRSQISRADMEREYVIQWKNTFSKRLWMGRRVQELFGGEYTTAMFFKIMEALPQLAKGVIRATHGVPF